MNSTDQTLQFPEVFVVEASAGSGKTHALAKRYIQLLLHPALTQDSTPMRQILAITFTNKAAIEMKVRILEQLKKTALGLLNKREEGDLLEPLGISRISAQERAFEVMETIIHHYNFFQVQTIDSFINALLSGCSFKVGLSANFKIKTNAQTYLEYSLDDLLEMAHHDQNIFKIFKEFLHHYLYLENRSGWFPKKDMMSILSNLYRHHNLLAGGFKESFLKTEALIKEKKLILKMMKTLKSRLPAGVDKRFLNNLENFLDKNPDSFDIDDISEFFSREEVPVKKGEKASQEAQGLWHSLRGQLQKLCEMESHSLFDPYIAIFHHVLARLEDLTRKEDILFLEELSKRARFLFDATGITVEELYYRLATRFHHYLIDEFQDTSLLQWQNMHLMAEEALSTGGSLFYVGDKKQAIYGFRGGEVKLFDYLKKEFQAFHVHMEVLTANWRSLPAIIDFNNQIFSLNNLKRFISAKESYELEKHKHNALMFNEEDINDILDVFSHAEQSCIHNNPAGYLEVKYIDMDKKEERDAFIKGGLLETLDELRKRFSPEEIAILTRSNREVEQITGWLIEKEWAVKSERTSHIVENPLIGEIIFLLRFLNSPMDNLAFAQFIAGDIFTKATGLSKDEVHDFLFKNREAIRSQKDFSLYGAFRQQFPKIWQEFLEEFFKSVGLYPLYELVVSMIHRFACLKSFKEQQGFFMHFLELIKKREDEIFDLSSFLEYLEDVPHEDAFVPLSDQKAVNILTIHKAKGLQFPVVIIPFLGMDVQIGSQGKDQQQSYIIEYTDDKVELLRLKKKYTHFSPSLAATHRQEYKRAFLSELSNIYVALTRAQYELYAFIPKRSGQSSNLVHLLIPEDSYGLGEKLKTKEIIKKPPERHPYNSLPASSCQDWIGFLKDEFIDRKNVFEREHLMKGEAMHRLLSFVGNCVLVEEKKLMESALSSAKKDYPFIEGDNFYSRRLKEILHQEDLRPFFYIEEGEVYTEKEIVNRQGHTKRMDRLIVRLKEVWVVDYKSSQEEHSAHEEQLREYMQVLKELFPKKGVRGFLLYMDELDFKEVQ